MHVTPRFWLANRVTTRSVDLLFRVVTADVISMAGRHRFLYSGIGPQQLSATLRRVRGIGSWPIAWVHTARHYLRRARQAERRGDLREAAQARAAAALCYHFAQIFELNDLGRKRRLASHAIALFHAAAPHLDPPVAPVEIPWRDLSLPGYLRIPRRPAGPHPLLVLLNGASTVKEETVGWSDRFLDHGFATLALDTPGSGEAWERVLGRPDQDDIADALLDYAEEHPELDADRIAVLGVSLRGALAVQLAARQDRFAAAVSVTSPYHPAPYFRHLNALVVQELAFLSGAEPSGLAEMVEQMSLEEIAPRLRVPLLVVGAGNDLVVPPQEAIRLYEAAGGPKHLHFIRRANHVAFSHMDEWTTTAANWLEETVVRRPPRRAPVVIG